MSRLARYNVTAEALSDGGDKVKYFEGTPIPTSIVLVARARLGRVAGPARRRTSGAARGPSGRPMLHPLALLFVLSGTLMISKTLRIPKL